MRQRLVIAIDGPAGSGKSTVARALAGRLRLPHVDTGAIYRALTLKAMREGVDPADATALGRMSEATDIQIRDGSIVLDGEDVTREIRSPKVTEAVSIASAHPAVRRRMVEIQRRLLPSEGAVVEGRDIGTVVLPNADLKVFLVAAPEERARRRARDLAADGIQGDPAAVLEEINLRDRLDSERPVSPPEPAQDAIVIDSTDLALDEVVDRIVSLVEERRS
ncbi:MAG: (d)CMP kinase [Actinomycetota bacterium]